MSGESRRGGGRNARDASNPAGALLRHWRRQRKMSQLALALEAEVSPRHVCFIETGRSKPSREMIHLLSEALDIPFRERNALLLAAGFAPAYREATSRFAGDELAPVRSALDAILSQQEPFPAIVMNRHWEITMTNRAADRFFAFLLGEEPVGGEGPVNVLRAMFHPDGLRRFVKDWESAAAALVGRVHREAVGGVLDEEANTLLSEILGYPGVPPRLGGRCVGSAPPVIPVTFEKSGKTFNFFSTVTTFGTPLDVLLQELRIECFFPLDSATRKHAEDLAPG